MSNFTNRRGRGGRGRGSRQFNDGNSVMVPRSILSVISKLESTESFDIALCLMDANSGALRYIQNPDQLTVSQMAALLHHITRAIDNDTSPAALQRLLKELVTSRFITNKIVSLLVQDPDWIALNSALSNGELENFLVDVFKLTEFLLLRLESLAYDNLYLFIMTLEPIMAKNKITEDCEALFRSIVDIRNRITTKRNKKATPQVEVTDAYALPPNNFKDIPILPTSAELKEEQSSAVFLRANKVKGRYSSVEDYLDVQYRLMREDFLSPLRDGVQEYMAEMKKKNLKHDHRLASVRMYLNTKVLYSIPANAGVAHVVQFNIKHFQHVDWERSSRLRYGSLVILSKDNFQTIYFGVVLERSLKDISNGLLTIQFTNPFPLFDQDYVMLESICYFEAYRHILSRLKMFTEENFPLSRYIVKCEVNVTPPVFLSKLSDVIFDLSFLAKPDIQQDSPKLKVEYKGDSTLWPDPGDLVLDESQYNSLKMGLTKELAIIQGPPGTGKTYVGLKIVQVLLQSVQARLDNFGPIFLVCYTNHALDQFIEGVAEIITNGIVRVGGQSKSEKLQKFMIHKLRNTVPRDYHVSGRLRQIRNETADISSEICKYRAIQTTFKTNIHTINSLDNIINKKHLDELKAIPGISSKDIIRMWLLGQIEQDDPNEFNEVYEDLCEEETEKLLLEVIQDELGLLHEDRQRLLLEDKVDMSEELNAWERNLRIVDDDDDDESNNVTSGLRLFERTFKEVSSGLCEIDVIDNMRFGWQSATNKKTMKDYVRRQLFHLDNRMSQEEVDRIGNIWHLRIDQRWRLYKYWLWLYSQHLDDKCRQMEDNYNALMEESGQLRHVDDMAILAKAKIIGMTTTGAARYGRVLNEIKPKILLVEEAAEVLESHIVSSLSVGSEQVILIGDHKQLKPTPAVYRLAKHFQLDISLFERLVANQFPHQTLALQHRMRPEISEIMQFIYPDLKDHEVVKNYPSIRGVEQNITFINHTEPETFQEEGKSCFNQFEAEYCVALCRHFLLNDYKPSQITILALYSGQLHLIQTLMPKHIFEGVRLTSVDNYQGEENDIILLSLVRSNDEERIGFSGIENRICVSLSRAKMGLFVLGNFELLSTKSDLWFKVVKHMQRRDYLQPGVRLKCQSHPESVAVARTSPDFARIAPEGGCDKLCGQRLSCGHQCAKSCHVMDQEHEDYHCMKPCAKTCKNGHPCKRSCSDECSLCMESVETIMPVCGHTQMIPCHQSAIQFSCRAACDKVLPCGHTCQLTCGQICSTACLKLVKKTLPLCQHEVEIACSIDPFEYICKRPCESVLGCGHQCSGTCGRCSKGRLHIPCKTECNRALVCGHICKSGCPAACPPCIQPCMDRCCHNVCTKKCSETCVPCKEPCYWWCQHGRCNKLCSEMCNKKPCDRPCKKHYFCCGCYRMVQCVGLCDEPCPMECRNCQREQLQEIFFGNEDYEGNVYITLWSCGHTFEVGGLDQWMNTDSGSIQPKTCPKCNTPINLFSTFRYGNIVKRLQADIDKVKRKMNSRRVPTAVDPIFPFTTSTQSFDLSLADEVLLNEFGIQPSIFKVLKIRSVDDNARATNCKSYLQSVRKLLEHKKEVASQKSQVEAYRDHFYSIRQFIQHLNPFLCCYSQYEVKQLNEELDRLSQMHKLLSLFHSVGPTSSVGIECLNTAITPLAKIIGYPPETKQHFEKIYQKLQRQSNLPFAGHSEEERTEIIAAMQFRQGHWYKCPNNHVYTIGNCGNPNQQGVCPECQAPIGGMGYLVGGNSLLQMDETNRPIEL